MNHEGLLSNTMTMENARGLRMDCVVELAINDKRNGKEEKWREKKKMKKRVRRGFGFTDFCFLG